MYEWGSGEVEEKEEDGWKTRVTRRGGIEWNGDGGIGNGYCNRLLLLLLSPSASLKCS